MVVHILIGLLVAFFVPRRSKLVGQIVGELNVGVRICWARHVSLRLVASDHSLRLDGAILRLQRSVDVTWGSTCWEIVEGSLQTVMFRALLGPEGP